MKTFHLTVAKVGENIFDGEATSITLPGTEGVFQALSSHEPFVSGLKSGTMSITTAGSEVKHIPIPHGGIAEISRGQATILL